MIKHSHRLGYEVQKDIKHTYKTMVRVQITQHLYQNQLVALNPCWAWRLNHLKLSLGLLDHIFPETKNKQMTSSVPMQYYSYSLYPSRQMKWITSVIKTETHFLPNSKREI